MRLRSCVPICSTGSAFSLAPYLSFFFFFNDTATTEIYTLSLHDALPIYTSPMAWARLAPALACALRGEHDKLLGVVRSEEHTSELQSPCNLVCRLLLEKKKNQDSLHVLINDEANPIGPPATVESEHALYQ